MLEIFHFALKPGSYLFLGSSETAESLPDLFAPADKKHRVFRRLDAATTFCATYLRVDDGVLRDVASNRPGIADSARRSDYFSHSPSRSSTSPG